MFLILLSRKLLRDIWLIQKRPHNAAKFQQDALHGIQAEDVPNATLCMEQKRCEADVLRCKGQPVIESFFIARARNLCRHTATTRVTDHEFMPQAMYNA